MLRQVLAGEEDGAVVIVQTGFCTNLARLLRSPPDKFSPLSGRELVRRRVRLISMMGGNFATPIGGEYNIETDIEAATSLLRESPVQIVVSGYEIGNRILFPAKSIGQDFTYVAHHPVAQAYGLYEHMPYDRPTWDLTSVLYAVRPERSFDVSEPGWMKVTSGGHLVLFPDRQGLHRYLKASDRQVDAALAVMLKLVAAPPGCRAKVCP